MNRNRSQVYSSSAFIVVAYGIIALGCNSKDSGESPDAGTDTEADTGTEEDTSTDTGIGGDYWEDGSCFGAPSWGEPASSGDCNGVSQSGCCDEDGNVVWCNQGELYCADCSPYECGWRVTSEFYDCGGSGEDPSGEHPMECPSIACSEYECPDSCVRYVRVDGYEDGDGLGWDSAFDSVLKAIASLQWLSYCCNITCQIWVAQGTYYIYQNEEWNALKPHSGIETYGGFEGNETSLEERDWIAHETVLDGRDGPDGSQHVLSVVLAKEDTVIDGFTITGGRALVDNGNYEYLGGGVRIDSCDVTIANCVFVDNEAYSGGGLAVRNGSAQIDNCRFEGNSAELGGAAFTLDSPVEVSRCVFMGNTAYQGGAVHLFASADTTVENAVFYENSAEIAGAVCVDGTSLSVVSSTFYANFASQSGGALVSTFEGSSTSLVSSVVWGNSPDAIDEMYGGTTQASYSDVQGGWTGDGNIDADPMFVDADAADLGLSNASPCIDAANGDTVPVLDIVGHPRADDPGTPNTGVGDPPYADMGAYEFQP